MDDFFARNRLSAYIDGELSPTEAREVEAALARSPELKTEYEGLREMVGILRSDGMLTAPPRLAEAIRSRTAPLPMPHRWSRWIPRVPGEAVALAAVVLLSLTYLASSGGDDPPPPVPVAALEPPPPAAVADAEPLNTAEPASANGILGDEARIQPATGRQSLAPETTKRASPKKSPMPEQKEAWQPAWESDEAPAKATTAVGYSPPPYRYKLDTQSESALRTLAALATELGGKLVDGSGRPLAAYPMDAGDSRSVRVIVPAYNVEALHARLRELGQVETMATDPTQLYAAGADVPVAIDVTVK